jgi:hypothetical protein
MMTLFPHKRPISSVKELSFEKNILPSFANLFLELSTRKGRPEKMLQRTW